MSKSKSKKKQFFMFSHELINSERYNSLPHSAIIILNYSFQFYYDNDADHQFTLPYSEIEQVLHIGRHTISKAIKKLIESKYWFLVKKGSRNRSAVYRHNHTLLTVNIE